MRTSPRSTSPGAMLCAASLLIGLSWNLAHARDLDLNKPEDAVLASRKIICGSLAQEYVAYAVWKGKVFSRVPWEQDRHLFDVVGLNVRQCPELHDATRGTGYRMISREVMLYLKPGTNEILDTWHNPLNGRDVKVLPEANDPVNPFPTFPYSKDGRPYRFNGEVVGDLVVRRIDAPLYYRNPLGGKYQDEIGGKAQAIELFTYFVNRKELLNDSKAPLKSIHLSWHRVAQWTPWMEMGDRPGYLIFATHGWRVQSYAEVPQILQDFLKQEEYAKFREPPPANDPRPPMSTEDRYQQVYPEGDKPDGANPF